MHLDGYNLLPYLTGRGQGPRKEFFYFSDDGDLTGLRYDNWKFVFMEQRAPGTLQVWAEPFTRLRVPKIFNLRLDPMSAPTSPRTPTTIGCSTMPSCWFPHKLMSASSWRHSRSFRPARRPQASPSIRRWRSCKSRTGIEAA